MLLLLAALGPLNLLAALTLPQEPVDIPPIPEFELEDLEAWRERILPAPEERTFEAIPWIPSFGDGVRRADTEKKPLLFWAMNGHPLGCT